MRFIFFIFLFFVELFAIDLKQLALNYDPMECVDQNCKIYQYDFDQDGKLDEIKIKDNFLIIDLSSSDKKIIDLRTVIDESCNDSLALSKDGGYLFLCSFGTDYGEIYIYKYDKLLKNWFQYGILAKEPIGERKYDYIATKPNKAWSIDKKIYRIQSEKDYLNIYNEILDLYRKGQYPTLRTLAKSIKKNKINLTHKTLTPYNNIAYYLQKAGANEEAIYLLEKIIQKFPNRTVAYINLGDAYWALGEKKKARKAYTTYIEQMCKKGLQKKIPQEVLKRVEVKDVCQ